MNATHHSYRQLLQEYHALCRAHGAAQRRCSLLIREQHQRIAALESRCLRLQAEVVLRTTALAWAQQDMAELKACTPDLPRRINLSRLVETLTTRVQDLMRERLREQWRAAPLPRHAEPLLQPAATPIDCTFDASRDDAPELEASLSAAELVICQTGCISHGAYWRVQDHCKRTGKTCVLVDQPEALRIVRLHRPPRAESMAASVTPDRDDASV
ncbi:MAG: DUF2325 domain-containing protein [Thiomonas sp.]|uniref:DUF2325 domain-containing protein n=1 Tax=Thiomonas sp. TaxID=2047785 RepID=UPI002A35BB2C|nr:DUF2325 domain-containing protein [Thiomonas sp.]MDY0329480.1 DUF2325 domain-containing protein [Thiomonas sp.]